MKKMKYLLFLLLFMPVMASASNHIYKIDMSVYLNEDGSANVTEVWDVDGEDGTEWYKAMYDLGNSQLTDFKVAMDSKELKEKQWDVGESLQQKAGYYGINYASDGIELCWGKVDYNRHTFAISYNLSNYVFNTSDSQVLYWKLVDTLSNVQFDHFTFKLSSYYKFSDSLDVWGYGYKGYAYVKDGIIEMSDESGMGNNYAVLLVKFPLNTFKTSNTDSRFNSFEEVYNAAEEGTFDYDYGNKSSISNIVVRIVNALLVLIPFIITTVLSVIFINKSKYGFKDNKVINKDNTPMFRDIPCNKDIYYANALTKANNFPKYKETNILGAIILKWVRQNKIAFKNQTSGIFNKETSVIDLTMHPTFDNSLESELFEVMYKASGDGILETREFEKWCRKHYTEFFNLFNKISKNYLEDLKSQGHIYKRTSKQECKYHNVMDDTLYEESKKLFGLKQFLIEFSQINTKEVIEVQLWDEYLMFAYIFGIADKVAKQLKDMYPEVYEQSNIDYNTILYVDNLSYRTVSAASNARSAAENYSGGGGGFSSGGGGGGSFGGGGGGSR